MSPAGAMGELWGDVNEGDRNRDDQIGPAVAPPPPPTLVRIQIWELSPLDPRAQIRRPTSRHGSHLRTVVGATIHTR